MRYCSFDILISRYYYGIQMKRDDIRLRQELQRVEESRAVSLQEILSEHGPLRRGSFVALHRKCGKPNCHCATGKGHPAKYLSVKENGRTRMIFIPSKLEETVADEAHRYRSFRRARAKLAKLARQSLELIDKLESRLLTTRDITAKSNKKSSDSSKSTKKRG